MTQANLPAGHLPAGVTSEMVEAALAAYESRLLDLHSTSFEAAEPISVWEIRSDCLRAALTAALAGRVVVPREPTDAMCEAGYSAGTGDWGGRYDNRRELARGRVEPTYRAMITAAVEGEG